MEQRLALIDHLNEVAARCLDVHIIKPAAESCCWSDMHIQGAANQLNRSPGCQLFLDFQAYRISVGCANRLLLMIVLIFRLGKSPQAQPVYGLHLRVRLALIQQLAETATLHVLPVIETFFSLLRQVRNTVDRPSGWHTRQHFLAVVATPRPLNAPSHHIEYQPNLFFVEQQLRPYRELL